MGCDLGEVAVFGENRDFVANALAGDQAVDGGADGGAFASAVTEDSGGLRVVMVVGFRQPVEGGQQVLDLFGPLVAAKPHQNFSQDDAAQGNRLVVGNGLLKADGFRRVVSIEVVNPDRRVDQHHSD